MYDESTGGERCKYYYLGSRLVGQTEGVSSQMRYLLTDRQGSVRAKTDANRVISYETGRGPYGAVLLGWAYQNGPALAGHMEDAISGLTYMEARYYDPVAMRFISPDPVGVSDSNGGNGPTRGGRSPSTGPGECSPSKGPRWARSISTAPNPPMVIGT